MQRVNGPCTRLEGKYMFESLAVWGQGGEREGERERLRIRGQEGEPKGERPVCVRLQGSLERPGLAV